MPINTLVKNLKKAQLRYVDDSLKGITRKKVDDSFKYFTRDGKVIKNKARLTRIKKLSIPPAWKNVWICPKPNGHLQATGIDDRGRKQYIYHPDWVKLTQENKFSKVVDFGLSLPKIRGKINYDLAQEEMDKRKSVQNATSPDKLSPKLQVVVTKCSITSSQFLGFLILQKQAFSS